MTRIFNMANCYNTYKWARVLMNLLSACRVMAVLQGVLHVFDLNLQRPDHIKVPNSSYTARMGALLDTGEAADVTFKVHTCNHCSSSDHCHAAFLAMQMARFLCVAAIHFKQCFKAFISCFCS